MVLKGKDLENIIPRSLIQFLASKSNKNIKFSDLRMALKMA